MEVIRRCCGLLGQWQYKRREWVKGGEHPGLGMDQLGQLGEKVLEMSPGFQANETGRTFFFGGGT